MKMLLINGSPRKGETYNVLEELSYIQKCIGNQCEIVNLGDYDIQPCTGCYQCFLKGENMCPIEDDVNALWDKIQSCDSMVVASPVYALGVTGTMKNFFDRIAWHTHRPTIYNKPAAIIATTAGMGTPDAIKQLKWIELLGFNIVAQKGFMKYPEKNDNDKARIKKENQILDIAAKLEAKLNTNKETKPNLIRVIQFYALKINAMIAPDVYTADNEYYKDKDFFYDTKISAIKKAMGRMFFNIGSASLKSNINFDN